MIIQANINAINNISDEEYDANMDKFIKKTFKKQKQKKFYESKKFNKYISYIRKLKNQDFITYINCQHIYTEQANVIVECFSKELVRENEKILLTPKRFNKLIDSIKLYNKEFVTYGIFATYYLPYKELIFEITVGQGSKIVIYNIDDIENDKIRNIILQQKLNKKLKKINDTATYNI